MRCKHLSTAGLAALLLFAVSASSAQAQFDDRLAIIHVTLLDVKTGEAKPDMTIIATGARITSLGKAADDPLHPRENFSLTCALGRKMPLPAEVASAG